MCDRMHGAAPAPLPRISCSYVGGAPRAGCSWQPSVGVMPTVESLSVPLVSALPALGYQFGKVARMQVHASHPLPLDDLRGGVSGATNLPA
jgi:hypothetical protein